MSWEPLFNMREVGVRKVEIFFFVFMLATIHTMESFLANKSVILSTYMPVRNPMG
jgi:hypothetical protein